MSVMYKVEILRAACCVAGADGEATKDELRLLMQLADQIGVGQASLQAMVDRSLKDREFWEEQFLLLKTKPEETLKILLKIAMSDRELQDAECTMLREFAKRLGLASDRFDRVLQQAKAHLDSRGTSEST